MSNREFLRVFQSYVRKVNLHPRKELRERVKRGNIFASSWSEKGKAERRATRLRGSHGNVR
jgi:hypothetical protein